MALTNETDNMVMPVSPMGGYNGGFGDMANSGWWIILLFILLGNNGWNGNWGGNGGVSNEMQRGFDQAALTSALSGLQNSVTNGFSDIQSSLCNGFNQTQMSGMQNAFGLQQAINNVGSTTSAGIESLKATIAAENCADRQAVADGVQSILTQMCNDKIDAKNEKIADLERQLTMANLAASQGQQTAQILADNAAQTAYLRQTLNPTAIPAYIVQNPNCCGQFNSCGCGA